MVKKNEEFLKKLLATFRVEADEHLQAMSTGLIDLEKALAGEEQVTLVEKIFREAHSLKGAARAVNLTQIETVCHALESTFSRLKGGQLTVSPSVLDLLHQAIAALTGFLMPNAELSGPISPSIATLLRQLENASVAAPAARNKNTWTTAARKSPSVPPSDVPAEQVDATTPTAPSTIGLGSETVRISTVKLDAVMRQVEELISPRLASRQRALDLHETAAVLSTWQKQRAGIQPALRLMDRATGHGDGMMSEVGSRQEFTKLLEYLDAESFHMKTLESRLARLTRLAEQDHRALATMTDGLLHDVKEMHLLPFSSLLGQFPRMVRELARDQAKEVELVMQGGEIEIDRRILEDMKNPLIHMIRNCIDHGIEKPEVRQQKQKPRQGTVTIAISQKDGGKVEILLADDGAGIDASSVKSAARKMGVVSAQDVDNLGEEEAMALIFQSGVSTSAIITEVSGRGLGLAIVREKVERLSGVIALESHPEAGTRIRVTLPVALATYRGVLVRASDQIVVIPAIAVERVIRVMREDIRTLENRETISLDGQAVSLVWLCDILETPRKPATTEASEKAQVVVLRQGVVRVAFRVEEILGEQEVLVKAFGTQLTRVRNLAGACALGAGILVPVLNVADLMKSAVKPMASPITPVAADADMSAKQRSILVVEDSITARALLKNILESAGYDVTTAVDGIDAYTTLKTGKFDLVVSDVEMPRMDGFGLTAKVRADKQLAELPVVLVTALASREHRERGVDVGANAYIVKSSFDQSNLLEVVGRLI